MNSAQNGQAKSAMRWSRFGLKSVLVFALLVAVALAAFQQGRRAGYQEGQREGFAAGLTAELDARTYRVSDLVTPVTDGSGLAKYQSLVSEIEARVQPTSWEYAGGPAVVKPYPMNLSLVVLQTEQGHKELAEFLEAKRNE